MCSTSIDTGASGYFNSSKFIGNIATGVGGIIEQEVETDVKMYGCEMERNRAQWGAICAFDGSGGIRYLTVTDTYFIGNMPRTIKLGPASVAHVDHCRFVDNFGSGGGNAIDSTESHVWIILEYSRSFRFSKLFTPNLLITCIQSVHVGAVPYTYVRYSLFVRVG